MRKESFFKWANPGLFFFIFVLFLLQFQHKLKKHRWCAWDSNPGPQDGRHRRNHGAMAATKEKRKLRVDNNWLHFPWDLGGARGSEAYTVKSHFGEQLLHVKKWPNYGHKTVCWRPGCCWLGLGPKNIGDPNVGFCSMMGRVKLKTFSLMKRKLSYLRKTNQNAFITFVTSIHLSHLLV